MSLPPFADILDPPGQRGVAALSVRSAASWAPAEVPPGPAARRLAAALLGYGLGPGDRVAVLATEGEAALVAQLAVLATAAILVPLDPASPDEQLRDAIARTGAVQVIASDERQLARVVAWRPELPALELILVMTAAPSERRPAALLGSTAMQVGARRLEEDPGLIRRALSAKDERAAAVLFQAAGSQEKSISRSELAGLGARVADTLGLAAGAPALAALPVTSLARLAMALAAVERQSRLCLAPLDGPLDEGLEGLSPRAALVDSGAVARLHVSWSARIDAGGWLSRSMTRWAIGRGGDSSRHPWSHRAAEALVFKGLRRHLGGELAKVHVVGPPLHPETAAFFASIGVPIRPFEVRMAR